MRNFSGGRILTAMMLALAAAGAYAANASAQSGLQSTDLSRLKSVDGARLSPDGATVAYQVTNRDRPRNPYSQVWLMDVAGKSAPHLLRDGGARQPMWSPDGKWIAFFGTDGEKSGLMIARPDGTESTLVAPTLGTNHPLPGAGDALAWSPDGKQIAYVSATPGPETESATGDPVVITRYLYKPTASEGMTRFNDNRRLHIFVADVATKQVKQLTDGTYYEHSIEWSPKGDEILFVSNHEDDPDLRFNYDVFAVRLADKSIRRVTNTENVEYKPTWSPDGRTIAYLGTKRGLTSSETTMEDTHVWLMDADGGNRRELGASIDNRQGAPEWSKDGRFVYYTLQEHGSTHLYRMPAAGGPPELIIGGQGRLGGWSLGPNGMVVYAFGTPKDMDQLFVKTATAVRQMTDVNKDLLGSRQIADVEAFTFRSFDGMEVEAFLTKPVGLNPNGKYPLIAIIHGGPHGQQGPEFQFKNQVYASHGMASIMINYRGSTGYGQKFADAIFGDQDGGEAKDVMTGVDAALRRYPWIDPKRLGVEGGSYGGQLSDWIVTQSNRFAAAIPIASISNLVSFNYMSYYHDYLAVEFGGFPHQDQLMDKLWQRSALRYVAQVRTPVMLVHGENDNDVPIAEAEQFYIALKDVGVETVMVRYPREGHGVREVGHTIDLIDRSMAWYDKHFGKAPTRPVSTINGQ